MNGSKGNFLFNLRFFPSFARELTTALLCSGVNLDGLFPFSESLNFEPMVCIAMGVDFC